MSKKILLVPIVIIGIVGVAWASSSMFPDRGDVGLPAFPAGSGTLGGILTGLFGIDGTARNTEKLGGISASGYLQGTLCPSDQIWKSIDQNGVAICGNRTSILAIGKFSEVTGGVQVKKAGTTNWISANTTDTLQSGDIIKTNGGSGTLRFTADESLLRLDTGTLVQLDTGDLDGKTVAQAILQDGRLWGRVLTSTGINIGGGGLIAGVRGTSVSVEKEGSTYHLSIPHSIYPTDAATVTCSTGGSRTMKPGSILNSSSGCAGMTELSLTRLYENTWIAENTRRDLAYLDTKSAGNTKVQQEIAATDPQDLTKKRDICTGTYTNFGGIWDTSTNRCLYGYADYTGGDTALYLGKVDIVMDLGRTTTMTTIRDDGNFADPGYWNPGKATVRTYELNELIDIATDGGNGYGEPFRTILRDKIATGYTHVRADITGARESNDNSRAWDDWTYPRGITFLGPITPESAGGGILIDGTGEYISYNTGSIGTLAGKTITIEFVNAPNLTNSFHELINLGGLRVTYSRTTQSWQCKITESGNFSANNCLGIFTPPVSPGNNIFNINIPSTTKISQFKIGNNDSLTSHINGIIKKVIIK